MYAGPQQATSDGTAEESDQDEVVHPRQTELSAEQGLKHLLLTVDVERLYRSAVATLHAIIPLLDQPVRKAFCR